MPGIICFNYKYWLKNGKDFTQEWDDLKRVQEGLSHIDNCISSVPKATYMMRLRALEGRHVSSKSKDEDKGVAGKNGRE